MAGSKLIYTFGDLRQEVAYSSGWGTGTLVDPQKSRAEGMVKSGYKQFLFPPGIGDALPHTWSDRLPQGADLQ